MNSLRTMYGLIAALALFPSLGGAVLGQGTVNVNNRGLPTPQLVTFSRYSFEGGGGVIIPGIPGSGVVGTQYVAQIFYGPNSVPLGDVMPFRVVTTTSPGTWNPGASGIRTLEGYTEGQNVTMVVRVWDSSVFATWEQASLAIQQGLSMSQAGQSAPFTYTVGAAANPASLAMVNFQGFELTRSVAVPEPGVMALGILGGIGLIGCLRRW